MAQEQRRRMGRSQPKGPPREKEDLGAVRPGHRKPDKEVVRKSLQPWFWVDEDKGLRNLLSCADSWQEMKSQDVVLWNFEETGYPVYGLLVQ
jgi:hypothetical protein